MLLCIGSIATTASAPNVDDSWFEPGRVREWKLTTVAWLGLSTKRIPLNWLDFCLDEVSMFVWDMVLSGAGIRTRFESCLVDVKLFSSSILYKDWWNVHCSLELFEHHINFFSYCRQASRRIHKRRHSEVGFFFFLNINMTNLLAKLFKISISHL